MAFYPAHCDNNCKGCEKNKSGWCIWKDIATSEYRTESFKLEKNSDNKTHYIPIPQNAETQRQVNAILAIEKLKREFDQMSDEDKQRIVEQIDSL